MGEKNYKFFYRENLPNPRIEHLIFGFFEFSIKSDSAAPLPHEVFPDGCVSILYRRNKNLNIELLLLKGISIETFRTEVFDNDIYWGFRILPAVSAKVLRCDPGEIPTQPVFSNDILPHLLADLLNQLRDCENFEEAIGVFTNKLENLQIPSDEVDEEITRAVDIIKNKNGEIKIAEIADKIGLSRRQLERRFKKCSGISPKQLARTYRLRATAINLLEKDMNWANRAAEMGFTDQSHLTAEIKSLTGQKPKSFEKKIKTNINYEKLIK